jgi:hypothetical protein
MWGHGDQQPTDYPGRLAAEQAEQAADYAASKVKEAAAHAADQVQETLTDAAHATAAAVQPKSGHARAAFEHGEHDAAHLIHQVTDTAKHAADAVHAAAHSMEQQASDAFKHGELDAARLSDKLSAASHRAGDAAASGASATQAVQQHVAGAVHSSQRAAGHAADQVTGAATAVGQQAAAAAHAAARHTSTAFRQGQQAAADLNATAQAPHIRERLWRPANSFLRSAAQDAKGSFQRATQQLLGLVGITRKATHRLSSAVKDAAADAAGGPMKAAQQLCGHTGPPAPAGHITDADTVPETECTQHTLDRILHNTSKWQQDQLPISPLPRPPASPTQHTSRLSAALLGARHSGRFGDVVWMATTPADLHETPQTAGQALARMLTGGELMHAALWTALDVVAAKVSPSALASQSILAGVVYDTC